ncbi:hypothetical protein [Microbacterium sp. RU33B]|uniref:hypothetical protein n=1 Tax=Microbacterium sp. RU33B TaxID=1907390 RepID=UPI00095C36B1|nr:hypothetical protein [Microbacterium sp. RU33B]SIT69514.1 hypothetical protein SAMN05880545_0540 [Microbacterium sp. RU33B]
MDPLEAWTDFNVAMAGATAALAGLVIVAASVNIADIVKAVSLTARLAAGISSLVLALSVSALGLIPEFSTILYGACVLVLAVVSGVFQSVATRRIYENVDPANRWRLAKAAIGFVAPGLYAAGGIALLIGEPVGLLLFAFGAVVAIMTALLVSWVVLVEVLR